MAEDEDDDSDKEDGVVGNLQQQIRTQYDKGMLELRLQLVRMRTEYLNNINTQSTLLVSAREDTRAKTHAVELERSPLGMVLGGAGAQCAFCPHKATSHTPAHLACSRAAHRRLARSRCSPPARSKP